MSSTRWQRVWDIFFEALELPLERRAAFINERCSSDEELRLEVDELLKAHEKPAAPLERSDWILPTPLKDSQPEELPEIEGYRILGLLGEGGMGLVYEAEQDTPIERRVALKVIKPGMDSRAVLRRFDIERQSLARMNHPGIAQVFDAGLTANGRPYFVMEIVKGMPVTRYCDQNRLVLIDRIELFRKVCSAVQHAHQKGVIHRDLKPSNVLVSSDDSDGQPKIIDFGIARALNKTDDIAFTRINELVGTPEYMSPEQARVEAADVDTRTDIYSLGVMLYEMLTGSLPFDAETLRSGDYYEIQRIFREEDPVRPSQRLNTPGLPVDEIAANRKTDAKRLAKTLSGDLDSVVMKALEKERVRRYDTVGDFSNDLARYLQNRPVHAHPPRANYKIRKFIMRHKVGVAAGAATLLALVVAVIGISMGLIIANREKKHAETVSNFLQDMLIASQPENAEGRDTTYLQEVLASASKRVDSELKDQPEAAANLHFTIGLTYKSLGLFDEASKHLNSALNLRQIHLGNEDPLTLSTLTELATLRWSQGEYKSAEAMTRQALGSRNLQGEPRLFALNTLGLTLKSTGRIAEAEQIYRQVADIRRQTLGIEDLATLTSVSNLARLLEDQGKLYEAEKLMREVVDVGRKEIGANDPHTLVSLDILGVMVRKQGRLQEAEALHREALQGCRRVLGDNHVDTLGVRRNLALLLMDQGKLDEAESEFAAILDVVKREYGEESFYTMMTASSLADCFQKQEKYQESASMYARARKIGDLILPSDHQMLIVLKAKEGGALLKDGQLGRAERLLVESYPELETRKGLKDPLTIATRNHLYELYSRTNRQKIADRYLQN